jgi:tRNA/rRNA methyltransferase
MAAEADGTVGLVFGNEESGLTTAELAECSAAVTIPSAPAFPSLNLSHAVQIMTYVLHRHGKSTRASTPVTVARLERAVLSMVDHLNAMDYFALAGPAPTRRLLSDVLGRARVTEGELRDLERIFRKLRYRCAEENGKEA